jgi:hypothetical protein
MSNQPCHSNNNKNVFFYFQFGFEPSNPNVNENNNRATYLFELKNVSLTQDGFLSDKYESLLLEHAEKNEKNLNAQHDCCDLKFDNSNVLLIGFLSYENDSTNINLVLETWINSCKQIFGEDNVIPQIITRKAFDTTYYNLLLNFFSLNDDDIAIENIAYLLTYNDPLLSLAILL